MSTSFDMTKKARETIRSETRSQPKPAQPKSWTATAEQIRANDYNLTASRYCPYQAEAEEYEKPDELIEQVIALEGQIQDGLKDLLSMVKEAQG